MALTLFVVLIAIIALEGAAWVTIGFLDRVRGTVIPDPKAFLAEQSKMLQGLLTQTDRREQIHPVLGWTYRPGYESPTDRITAQSLRASREYDEKPPAGVRRIAAFGDSYIYSNEVSNDESWAAQIESGWNAEVLNYGVGGYGLDQAFIRFQQEGARLHPDVVIMGFTPMMAPRMVSRYRRFQEARDGPWFKPRFVIRGGALQMLPAPVASREDAERLIKNPEAVVAFAEGDDFYMPGLFDSSLYRWSRAYRLAYFIRDGLRRRNDKRRVIVRDGMLNEDSEAFELAVRVFTEFAAAIRAIGAHPAALLLPGKADAEMYRRLGHASYETLHARVKGTGIQVIDAAAALAASPAPLEELFHTYGHYSPQGDALVAKSVAEALNLAPRPYIASSKGSPTLP